MDREEGVRVDWCEESSSRTNSDGVKAANFFAEGFQDRDRMPTTITNNFHSLALLSRLRWSFATLWNEARLEKKDDIQVVPNRQINPVQHSHPAFPPLTIRTDGCSRRAGRRTWHS